MRIACVQMDVAFKNPMQNAWLIAELLLELRSQNVNLAVFPECCLTGYVVRDEDDVMTIGVDTAVRPGGPLNSIQDNVDITRVSAIVGFAERSVYSDGLRNAAALLRPQRPMQIYRKSHLPELALDKYVTAGDELPLFDTEWGKIGILICYDQRLPEPARVLALKGADLIVLPTNWPEGAETSADHVCITRAAENHIFYAACNRVGTENGFTFFGRSKIIGPTGKVLASAGSEEEIIYADINLAEARSKRIVVIPGQYELPVFGARRPELYGIISESEGAPS